MASPTVQRLVIPAEPECVHSWTSRSFGRREYQEVTHLQMCERAYQRQQREGRHGGLEQPKNALSWKTKTLESLEGHDAVFDQCQFGRTLPDENFQDQYMKNNKTEMYRPGNGHGLEPTMPWRTLPAAHRRYFSWNWLTGWSCWRVPACDVLLLLPGHREDLRVQGQQGLLLCRRADQRGGQHASQPCRAWRTPEAPRPGVLKRLHDEDW